ncbi:MAG: uroporphyrinogen decarboxylase family protein [Eubacteriales bacterium]|jgi:uroporphyrinogen decarboxylase
MNLSKKRVIDALEGRIPDKVPFMFAFIDKPVQDAIAGRPVEEIFDIPYGRFPHGVPGQPTVLEPYDTHHPEVARKLGLDAIGIRYMPPIFAEVHEGADGHQHLTDGLLITPEAINSIQWPDIDDDRLYEPLRRLKEAYGGEFAIYAGVRMGISFTLNSMGLVNFSYAIYDEPNMVKELVDQYAQWAAKLYRNLISAGADFLWSFDDLAFKSMPMFTPDVLREFFLPYVKQAADAITVPWIFHSDGNLFPVLDDLMTLGMNGIHPLEPGSMDLAKLKAQYGDKLTLIGNIDIDHTLYDSPVEEVEQVVKDRIDLLGPGGRYIISDSNSVPYYCKPENVMAAAEAVQKYRNIY